MKTRIYSKTGESLSHLGFGGMRFPQTPEGMIDRERAGKMLEYAYENGVRYFDTAYGYHNGESARFFGDFLCEKHRNDFPRESYKIANKLPLWPIKEAGDVERIFYSQLASLKTDYIDFYLLHALNGELWQKAKSFGAYEFCRKKKDEGIIKNLGFSYHGNVADLKTMLSEREWDFVQLQFNYLDYFTGTAKAEYETVVAHGLQVIVMEPIRGGALANLKPEAAEVLSSFTEASQAAFALRFVSTFENVLVVLSGMSSFEQVTDNINTFSDIQPLTKKEFDGAMRVAAAVKGNFIPCTGCRYCTEDCPMDISIPETLAKYNEYLSVKPENPDDIKPIPDAISEEANKCAECGACEKKCPQSIKITSLLAKMRGE